ncbi:MAG: homocysteine S-methyltransferase family protein [Rhodospirillum sp.]|nr:homocysteine S-methyltransferase family protein [Rhodospirillum sp.]MCF8488849.1 homocysteine S-methyltransferase family protein [Rhodospirillum sp.]MCF8500652.1 homocysteine S-methyltransferase family protein [Rhodospirillum sp.]
MPKYRDALPQLSTNRTNPFITDGGMGTTFIYRLGLSLPHFAAFTLLETAEGEGVLWDFFASYAQLARDRGIGILLDTPTWRASADWGEKLGYDAPALERANLRAVDQLLRLRAEYETAEAPLVISGCIGPRGDGYNPERPVGTAEARAYHAAQIETFARSETDMISAMTLTHGAEALGMVQAAVAVGIPIVPSFTLETNGHLPSGETLGDAIALVDDATGGAPPYYQINCAHPVHFRAVLETGGPRIARVRAVRVNASDKSHAELDNAITLDEGDPEDLGRQVGALSVLVPNLVVAGGCCGTDHRHIVAIHGASIGRG